MSDDPKPGDIVRLKSGGPTMTVGRVGESGTTGRKYVACIWFDGLKKIEEDFPPESLDRI